MPGFGRRLSDGVSRAVTHPALLVVPILLALLETDKLLAITSFDGGHVGFRFGLPVSVVTVWQFVSVPQSGVTVEPGVSVEGLPFAVVTVPLVLVVKAAVTAGYYGSLRNALDGDPYEFLGNARRYFPPFLVLTVLPVVLLLPLAAGVFGLEGTVGAPGPAVLLWLVPASLVLLVVAYLFYPTPYLVVLRDLGLLEAARESYALAAEGGPYLAYTVGFVLFVVLVSPFATALVVNVPVVGLPAGILAGGVLGLGANLATMRFIADLDPEASVDLAWENTETRAP